MKIISSNTEVKNDVFREMTAEQLMTNLSLIKIKAPTLPNFRKIGLFESIMNKLGWYRQREIYLIDRAKIFNPNSFPGYDPMPGKAA